MGLGVIFVNQLVKYDEKLKEDLDKMLDKAKAANESRYFGSALSSFLPLPFSPLLLQFLAQPPIWPFSISIIADPNKFGSTPSKLAQSKMRSKRY
ncbi:hypothetical protein BHM03_00057863 [Ensete ventricosum]|nr:hypothetical protein BHM03_00057863 [Ensete ventricosum]